MLTLLTSGRTYQGYLCIRLLGRSCSRCKPVQMEWNQEQLFSGISLRSVVLFAVRVRFLCSHVSKRTEPKEKHLRCFETRSLNDPAHSTIKRSMQNFTSKWAFKYKPNLPHAAFQENNLSLPESSIKRHIATNCPLKHTCTVLYGFLKSYLLTFWEDKTTPVNRNQEYPWV